MKQTKQIAIICILILSVVSMAYAHTGIKKISHWGYESPNSQQSARRQSCGPVEIVIPNVTYTCGNRVSRLGPITPAIKVYENNAFLEDNCPLGICEYSMLAWERYNTEHSYANNINFSYRTTSSVKFNLTTGNHSLTFYYLRNIYAVQFDNKSQLTASRDLCHANGDAYAYCLKPVDKVLRAFYGANMPPPTLYGIGPLPPEYNESKFWNALNLGPSDSNYNGSKWVRMPGTINVEILPRNAGTIYLDRSQYNPGDRVTVTLSRMSCCGTQVTLKLMNNNNVVVNTQTAPINEIGNTVVVFTLPSNLDLTKTYRIEVSTNVDSPNCKARTNITIRTTTITCLEAKNQGNLKGKINYVIESCKVNWRGETIAYANVSNLLNPAAYPNATFLIGMASYRKYDEIIDNQIIFDYDTDYVAPGRSVYLQVKVPQCKFQVDLFCGPVLFSLNKTRYNDLKIDWAHKDGCYPINGSASYCKYCGDGVYQQRDGSCDYNVPPTDSQYVPGCRNDSFGANSCSYCGDGIWQRDLEQCDYRCTSTTCTSGGYINGCTQNCKVSNPEAELFCVGLSLEGGECVPVPTVIPTVPTTVPARCNVNRDAGIDILDLTAITNQIGRTYDSIYDINNDGRVDIIDYNICRGV